MAALPLSLRIFRQTSILIAAAAAIVLGDIPAVKGQATLELTSESRRKIDEIVQTERDRLKIPGLGVAIALNGRLEYVKSSGFADLENRLAVDDESRFRSASLAKPITATAVMQLVERGAISLDAPIQRYCPAFPEKPWPITTRQLLGHLAGVRHYKRNGESTGTQHYFTLEDSLAIFKNDPLLHEPGTKYEYSTYGFSVLGCAVEGASKTRFAAYVQTNVFDRARMAHTAIDDLFQIVPKRVRGYLLLTADQMKDLPPAAQAIARPDTVYNTVLHDTSMKIPGGFVSTPSDYARFVLALLDHTLVGAPTLDAMWTSQKTRDGVDTEYGYGFGVQMRNGRKNVTHSGNQAGASSLTRISPERRAVLVVMTNLEDAPLGQLANAIAPVVLGPSR